MSATAALVQLGIAVETARGNGYGLPQQTIQLAENRFGGWARNPVARSGLLALQALTVPNLSRHFVARKRQILRWAEDAVARSVQRIVILGAGCDGLGPYLALTYSDITIIEVHMPAEVERRRLQLQIHGLLLHNLSLQGQNLSAGLPTALSRSVHEPTLVIVEGVLMYLSPWSACRLLRKIADQHRCHELIASFALPRADGRLAFVRARPWAAWWLARKNETWRWALDASRALNWIERRGFKIEHVAGVFADTWSGENIALPCRGESVIHVRRPGFCSPSRDRQAVSRNSAFAVVEGCSEDL